MLNLIKTKSITKSMRTHLTVNIFSDPSDSSTDTPDLTLIYIIVPCGIAGLLIVIIIVVVFVRYMKKRKNATTVKETGKNSLNIVKEHNIPKRCIW